MATSPHSLDHPATLQDYRIVREQYLRAVEEERLWGPGGAKYLRALEAQQQVRQGISPETFDTVIRETRDHYRAAFNKRASRERWMQLLAALTLGVILAHLFPALGWHLTIALAGATYGALQVWAKYEGRVRGYEQMLTMDTRHAHEIIFADAIALGMLDPATIRATPETFTGVTLHINTPLRDADELRHEAGMRVTLYREAMSALATTLGADVIEAGDALLREPEGVTPPPLEETSDGACSQSSGQSGQSDRTDAQSGAAHTDVA